MSPDAYGSHKYLEQFDVLKVESDDARRSDGTVPEGTVLTPHRFTVLEFGFDSSAAKTITYGLPRMSPAPSASRMRAR